MTVAEMLASAARRIGGSEARLEAELLVAHALGRSRAWLYAWPERVLDAPELERCERLVAARERGEPVAYLTGHREFWSLDLEVTPDVLIPRPETELLVERALAAIPREANAQVADLGTGSGAIALAIAHERPRARVLATDASAAALAVARANATKLELGNVEFALGDWCTALGDRSFDVIVSNPPYIAEDDPHLALGDLRFEPRPALASGRRGLDAIARIVECAGSHLASRGYLMFEHGLDQGAPVRELMARHGFIDVETARDLAGHERVTSARSR